MIYFIRHGSTDWNENKNAQGEKDPRCQGRYDLSLNQTGIAQAKALADKLKKIKIDKIYCSPLKRTKETLFYAYNGTAPIIYDSRIIERDFGEFEGFTRSEFDFNGFWNLNSSQSFSKAESIADVQKRLLPFLEELKNNPDENVLIVSHGGTGAVLMSYFLDLPKDGNFLSFELHTGDIRKLTL